MVDYHMLRGCGVGDGGEDGGEGGGGERGLPTLISAFPALTREELSEA